MLKIKKRRKLTSPRSATSLLALGLLVGGGYMLSLAAAPTVAPIIATKPITVSELPEPKITDNRIVIPKIGVNIVYGSAGKASLDRGAWWRYPERGNPVDGGNFIIAAHRFTIMPTPRSTIEKSPFYNIDKLVTGDKVVIDYKGVRYAYEINEIKHIAATQIEIEERTDDPRLTLYTCGLGGAKDGRIALFAKPIGQVALAN